MWLAKSAESYGLGRGVVVTARAYDSDIIELASIYVRRLLTI